MKITQNVRDYASQLSADETPAVTQAEIEAGLNQMKDDFHNSGQKLYHKV